MAQIIDMPKLSDTMTVGTLVKWLKNEGDKVKTGDMLAEVETDKATMELECFFDGTLLKIFAQNGAQVAIGDPLCAVGKPGEVVETPAPKAAPSAAAPAPAEAPKPAAAPAAPAGRIRISPLARKLAESKGIDPSTLTGSGPGGRILRAGKTQAAAATLGNHFVEQTPGRRRSH